jgi:hypothetical protein
MTDILPLEKLRSHAVRDPDILTPGTLLVMAHVPDLYSRHGGGTYAYAQYITVQRVEELSHAEMHPEKYFKEDEEWAHKSDLMLFYFDKLGEHTAHCADYGVIPYGLNNYNDTNFVVRVSDLVDAGLSFSLKTSDEYNKRMETKVQPSNKTDFIDFIPSFDDYSSWD